MLLQFLELLLLMRVAVVVDHVVALHLAVLAEEALETHLFPELALLAVAILAVVAVVVLAIL